MLLLLPAEERRDRNNIKSMERRVLFGNVFNESCVLTAAVRNLGDSQWTATVGEQCL